MKLLLSELHQHTQALVDEPGRGGEKYCCDCGCGGDDAGWWEQACRDADEARAWFAGHGIEIADCAAA